MRYGIQMLGSKSKLNFKELSQKAINDAKAASLKAAQNATIKAVEKIANPVKKTIPDIKLETTAKASKPGIMGKFGALPKWQQYGALGAVGIILIKVLGK